MRFKCHKITRVALVGCACALVALSCGRRQGAAVDDEMDMQPPSPVDGDGGGRARSGDARRAVTREPITISRAALDTVKARLRADDGMLGGAAAKLRLEAERERVAPLVTVMDKTGVAPSGDAHDYFSLGRYYWPTTDVAAPYAFVDGETNPEIYAASYDKSAAESLFRRIETLTLASYLFDNDRYAEIAVAQLAAWFVTPATRMHPHLAFAQQVKNAGGVREEGATDFNGLIVMLDWAALLERTAAWDEVVGAGLHAWLSAYQRALEDLPRTLSNHIGTWRDAQEAAVAHYLGDAVAAGFALRRAADATIPRQVDARGGQPLEAERALAWKAHVDNLLGFTILAAIATPYGVDVWSAGADRAQTYLQTFVAGARWPGRDRVDDYQLVEALARRGETAALGTITDQEKLSRERAALIWPWR